MDVNNVLEHTLVLVGSEAKSGGISIETSLTPEIPMVLADPEQCHQVFLNLFMNAFQAMNGHGALRVETKLASNPNGDDAPDAAQDFSPDLTPSTASDTTRPMVNVIISDTGEGIPPEAITRIFDPFFSTKDEGIGLGLSLVHKIIENHRGRIRVSSKQGAGTTFTISLPAAKQ
ncbi:MAG: hypothetical protein HY801_00725 [Candidatus Lindowbacteria bacterium]|nr:hypothetical protein [Candidatus Lindowbacteria bacterium]